jgi:23S rRNA (uridine2552-2'-O)-methyltransferase
VRAYDADGAKRHEASRAWAEKAHYHMVKSAKGGGGQGQSGSRKLTVRVRTAKGRKIASTRWLQRQLNDPYVEEARRQGYRSRAAFKLAEIDDKYHLLKPGMTVVDLGAAPGGWSQVAAQRVGLMAGKGKVVAIDLVEMEPVSGVTQLTLDMTDGGSPERIREALGGKQADVVLSDMHAPAMGHKSTDHLRIMSLVEAALDLAEEILAPGGAFLCKVLQGGADKELVARLNRSFAKVRHLKPKASRADSAEMYVLATGFRGSVA